MVHQHFKLVDHTDAQCIQRLPDDWHGRILGKLSAKIIHMILGFTAQPVPVQKPHALRCV